MIRIRRDVRVLREGLYESLETFYRPEFEKLDYDRERQFLRFERGKIETTPFGRLFMDACLTKLRQS